MPKPDPDTSLPPLAYAAVNTDAPPPHSKLGRAACLIAIPGWLGYAGHCVIVAMDLRSPAASFVLNACQLISFLAVLLGLTLGFVGLLVRRRRRLLPVLGLILALLLAFAWILAPVQLRR